MCLPRINVVVVHKKELRSLEPADTYLIAPSEEMGDTDFHKALSALLKEEPWRQVLVYTDRQGFFRLLFPYYAPFILALTAPTFGPEELNKISNELYTFHYAGLMAGAQRDYYLPQNTMPIDEKGYLSLLQAIRTSGERRPDRTGVGTLSTFGEKVVYSLTGDRIPLFTTKRVSFRNVLEELLFFMRGETDTRKLEERKVRIWHGNTTKDFIAQRGLPYEEGDMGPMYGFQWRHAGIEYEGAGANYSDEGLDQLAELVEQIKRDPFSRRHLLVNWNAAQISQMVLAPCHVLAQFSVSADGKYLDCLMYQRSGDMFLGVPYNVASYGLLTHIIAKLCGLQARKLIHMLGDAHIYLSHIKQVDKQLSRFTTRSPSVRFPMKALDEYVAEDFELLHYHPHPGIKAEMAV